MSEVGSESNPLRVAIIGAGPSGFYTVSNFLKQKDLHVEFDMFDRLPTPFGLVRAGVAPDHQKDKSVQRAYDKSAQSENFRFYGNVEYGRDIQLEDLRRHYHQVMFTSGAPFDRDLGIPGEELVGSHSATEFVAWYNGHPDFADRQFDLSQESVAVVGIGNVAMDVARILCKTHAELAVTDMADYALEALKNSQVKNVYILGRRGPGQAAFTPPEIKEMGEFEDADVTVPLAEATLDVASAAALEASGDKNAQKNVAYIDDYASREISGKSRLLTIRFLVSPTELLGEDGQLTGLKLVKNKLVQGDNGLIRAQATGEEEIIPIGLLFRSVGYLGRPLQEIPYNDRNGTIRNSAGRVESEDGAPVLGIYTAGWIKRGPTGVIGTNKTCARETVGCMLEDLAAGQINLPDDPSVEGAKNLIDARQPESISYPEWLRIDAKETAQGEVEGRPRVKLTSIEEMINVAKG